MNYTYQVGSKTFTNVWDSLRESHRTGTFSKLIIKESFKHSFLDIDPRSLPDNYTLMKAKAEYLNSVYKCRLHYSGGIDSHTLINLTNWPMHYMYLRGLIDVRHVDEEYMFGYDYLVEKDLPREIFYITLEHYEVWNQYESPFKYNDYYSGICPTWVSGQRIAEDDSYDLEITGYEKPLLYCANGNYYWVLHNGFDTLSNSKRVDFYLDNYLPELAVKQVYTYYDYYKNNHPAKTGFLTWKSTNQKELLASLGRDLNRPSQPVKLDTDHSENSNINYKQLRTAEELIKLDKVYLLEDWNKCTNHLISQTQDAPNGIEIVDVEIPLLGVCQVPKKIDRVGAIYKIHTDGLELLDHTDINLL